MILRAPTRLKPRPGQWIVATNGEGARVLLVTRVLPNRVFFREMVNGGSVENFVSPADVLHASGAGYAERVTAERINAIFAERDDAIRSANAQAVSYLTGLGIIVE